jgi:hypothetical protein
VFEAVATDGTGLLQALSTISKKVIRALREESIGSRGRTPLAPEPFAKPEPLATPAAPVRALPTPQEAMEEAILAEPDHPDHGAIDAESHAAASVLSDQPWLHEPDALEPPSGARIGPSLSIVSVGEATRADARSVRISLVLGDDEGGTSTVVLTIRLDPLLGGSGD